METELNDRLNFLGIYVIKHNNFTFDIYRKTTLTNITIPKYSTHPKSYKLVAYRSIICIYFSISLKTKTFKKK